MTEPKFYTIVSGEGQGKYPLLAFDNALCNAGVGDYNLVKVSSILPAGCQYKDKIDIEKGSIVYAAYSMATVVEGEGATVAVATAVPLSLNENGVIFEVSSNDNDAENSVRYMCKKAMLNRNREIKRIESSSIIVNGKKDTYICGVSAIIMW